MSAKPKRIVSNDAFNLQFENRFVNELPADPSDVNQPREVVGACYSRVQPTSTEAPYLVAYSKEVAEMLGLPESMCTHPDCIDVFSGNALIQGMEPYAMCYGGHQFGHWARQLGDGRAMSLGEVRTPSGMWEIQLKGAGPTPYSRRADGRAVMRSSVREFLCSEAMFHLGVPTTRALSLMGTGDQVLRDMLYDGNPAFEPGAVVCRVAPTFIRFGNFEIFASRGEVEHLRSLVDFTIRHHFPELGEPSVEVYTRWFQEICRRTARMIVEWMRVGFVHGVMNTDNMSIVGCTIDYGPYGWLDDYNPGWTPNTTDAQGKRYRFENQPQIGLWNLARLAEALHVLTGDITPFEQSLEVYLETFTEERRTMLLKKLGLFEFEAPSEISENDDLTLLDGLFQLLESTETDMTIFYRRLAEIGLEEQPPTESEWFQTLQDAYYDPDNLTDAYRAAMTQWMHDYAHRVQREGISDIERKKRMHAVNPKYVLRNYIAQLAIDKAEQGDGSMVEELLDVMRRPYDEQPDKEEYAQKRPEWARHRPGCSMLSCSS